MLDKFKDECGVFGIFGHPEAANLTYLGLYALQHRGQESAGIARPTARRCACRARWATSPTRSTSARSRRCRAHRHRPHALLDRGREQAAQRAADPDRLRARPDRHRAQRQPGERERAARPAGPRRIDLPDQQRHRGRPASLRALARAHGRGRAGRVDLAGQRRVFVRAADEGSADRRARSARLPSARARPARRRLHRLFRDLRARSDRRDLRPRRRARRGAHHQRRRAAVAAPVSDGAALALRLRARLFRASRQLRLRPERQRSPHRARTACWRGNRRVDADVVSPDSRLGRVRRDRLRRGVGDPDGDGADPQPLRRPDVHPAAAGDPPLQRPRSS